MGGWDSHEIEQETGYVTMGVDAVMDNATRRTSGVGDNGRERTIRVVLYSHDSQGIGHVRRNLALARTLAQLLPRLTGKKVSGLMISGLAAANVFPLPDGFDWFFIPSITKGDGGYEPRNLHTDWNTLRSVRTQAIQGALAGFMPDLIIVDRHLYGVDKELRKPLKKLRKKNPHLRVVLGMREVLDSPEIAAREWESLGSARELGTMIDEIWLYGDQLVHDPVATGEVPAYLADKVRYTGYLSKGRAEIDSHADLPWCGPFILTSAGGGSDGYALLSAAAAMPIPRGCSHVIIAGPQMSDSNFAALEGAAQSAGRDVHLYRMWPGLAKVVQEAAAVISMGGYNTTSEILATDTPALIVPREYPRKEQLIRARALEAHGAVDVVRLQDVNAETLGEWAADRVGTAVDRAGIERDGLTRMARLAADLLCAADVESEAMALAGVK